ncbi:MAG: hypothetical protein QXN87_07755 [Candidatus Bathyarchaeia archaeon]
MPLDMPISSLASIRLSKKRNLLVLLTFLMLLFWIMGSCGKAYGSALKLEDFPVPFVSGGFLNCTFVLASSDGHGPCGGAHTMDVMGAIMVSSSLGLKGDGGLVNAAMDDWISTYDFQAVKVTVKDLSSNLVVVGGPGVNQVTWHYNGLTDSNGNRILPVYFDKEENETDVIRVATSGTTYKIEYENGKVKADYGIVSMFYDDVKGFWILTVAGLGGSGTLAASGLLARYELWSLFGRASVVRFGDSNGDGYLEDLSVVESVGVGKSIGVYKEAQCLNSVESIEWGVLCPGETKSYTVYVRNEGENDTTLNLNVHSWSPAEASNYLTVNWNYTGYPIKPGQVVATAITLTVKSEVKGVNDFSMIIEVGSS